MSESQSSAIMNQAYAASTIGVKLDYRALSAQTTYMVPARPLRSAKAFEKRANKGNHLIEVGLQQPMATVKNV